MPKKNNRATNCSYCGRMGHVEARCYHAHPELAPPDWVIRRPGQGRGQRRQAPRGKGTHSNFPQPSRSQWVGTPTANSALATKTNTTPTKQSGSLNAITRDMTKLSITDQGQNKSFRLMDLPPELVLQVLGHCDVLALTRLLRTSKLMKSLVESLEIIEQISGNAKILGKLQIAVQRSKEHRIRKSSLPLDLSNWNPASILSSYKSEICTTCPPHEGVFDAPEGWGETVPHPWLKLLNATDGMYTCFACFLNTPGYRLALDIEEFKQAEEWIDYRPEVGYAKNYLENRVCRHGARLRGLQPIFLSREGGPTFARISRNLWAKVQPFLDSSGYDARDIDQYYSAEGCDKHPCPDLYNAPDDISNYDPDEI